MNEEQLGRATTQTWERSESFGDIAKALCILQSKVGPLEYDREGQTGNRAFEFVGLPKVLDVVKEHWEETGLSWSFFPGSYVDGTTIVADSTVVLWHGPSEQWMSVSQQTSLEVNTKGNILHLIGVAQGYHRRRGLMGLLGLVGREDTEDKDGGSSFGPMRQQNGNGGEMRGASDPIGNDLQKLAAWGTRIWENLDEIIQSDERKRELCEKCVRKATKGRITEWSADTLPKLTAKDRNEFENHLNTALQEEETNG